MKLHWCYNDILRVAGLDRLSLSIMSKLSTTLCDRGGGCVGVCMWWYKEKNNTYTEVMWLPDSTILYKVYEVTHF